MAMATVTAMVTATAFSVNSAKQPPPWAQRSRLCLAVLGLLPVKAWSQEGAFLRLSATTTLTQFEREQLSSTGVQQIVKGQLIEVSPNLKISLKDHPLTAELAYNPRIVRLIQDTDWQVVQQLQFNGKLNLIPKQLDLQVLGSVREQNVGVASLGTAVSNNTNPLDQRIRYSTIELSSTANAPTLGDTQLVLRSAVGLNQDQLVAGSIKDPTTGGTYENNRSQTALASVDWNSSPNNDLSWTLRLDGDLNRTVLRHDDKANAQGTLRLIAADYLRLYAQAGWQFTRSLDIGSDSDKRRNSASYTIGMDYVPSRRTRIGAKIGSGIYGLTYELTGSHRSAWTNQIITATRSNINPRQSLNLQETRSTQFVLDRYLTERIPDPIARAAEVDRIVNALQLPSQLESNRSILLNRELIQTLRSYSFVYSRQRFTAALSLSDRKLEPIPDSFDALLGQATLESRTQSATLRLAYRLDAQTSVSAGTSFSRANSKISPNWQQGQSYDWQISHQINKPLLLALTARYNHERDPNSQAFRRDKNIVLSLSYQF
jgi:uncharacterized protein (PEP-CTERM system associated)